MGALNLKFFCRPCAENIHSKLGKTDLQWEAWQGAPF